MKTHNPTLATRRLTLRPLVSRDAPQMVRMVNDYEISKWLTSVSHPYSIMQAHWYIRALQSPWRFAIECRQTGEFAGCIGISSELGYWLGRAHWGKGYMSEAARALVDCWMGQYGGTLTSSYLIGNARSQAILEGLGFVPGEMVEKYSIARQKSVQSRILTLTPDQYHAHNAH